jgi:hypothetical protein
MIRFQLVLFMFQIRKDLPHLTRRRKHVVQALERPLLFPMLSFKVLRAQQNVGADRQLLMLALNTRGSINHKCVQKNWTRKCEKCNVQLQSGKV